MTSSGNRGTHLEVIQSLRCVCFTVFFTCQPIPISQRLYGLQRSHGAASGKLVPGDDTAIIDPKHAPSSQALTGLYVCSLKH